MEVTPLPSIAPRNNMINLRPGKFQLTGITQNPAKQFGGKFKFIDTRSLWVNLRAIKRLVDTDALKIENLSSLKEVSGDQILSQETVAASATRSDLYTSAEGILVRNGTRKIPLSPSIELGPEFEKVSDLSRFKSIPSIIELDSLKVKGDVWFGAGITLKGRVSIVAKPGIKLEIPDGVVLENKEIHSVADIEKDLS